MGAAWVDAEQVFGPTELHERSARLALKVLKARSHRVRYGGGLRANWIELPGRGEGPTLVLVHGFSASGPSQYLPMIYHLLPRVGRIVLPDLSGHGRSELPPSGIDSESLCASLAAILEQALSKPAVLFATSMGGGVALRVALQRPDRIARLMLCSPLGAPISPSQARTLKATFAMRSYADALRFVDRLFPGGHALRGLYALGVWESFSRPRFRQIIRELDGFEGLGAEELASLKMPIYLLWGQADDLLPRAHLDYFRSHLPVGSLIDTPAGLGHAPFLRQSKEVVRRLLRFMHRYPEPESLDRPSCVLA